MDSLILSIFRIGLLAILWIFILVSLRAMRRDTNRAAGATPPRPSAGGVLKQERRAPANHIMVVEGPYQGSHMEISTLNEMVLGRSPECDFVLGDDYSSARHARLFRRGQEWFVEDLDSRNGTYVGGTRIEQPERVNTGTDIRIGRTTVRLAP